LLRDITDRAAQRGIDTFPILERLRDILQGTYHIHMTSHCGVPGFDITAAEAEQDLFEIVELAYFLGSMCPAPFMTEGKVEARPDEPDLARAREGLRPVGLARDLILENDAGRREACTAHRMH
jgi:hypothetical protein